MKRPLLLAIGCASTIAGLAILSWPESGVASSSSRVSTTTATTETTTTARVATTKRDPASRAVIAAITARADEHDLAAVDAASKEATTSPTPTAKTVIGVVASSPDVDPTVPPAPSWDVRPDELTITVGDGFVDVERPRPFPASALLPVLRAGDHQLSSSTYEKPNVLRFADDDHVVHRGDEVAFAYGGGRGVAVRAKE